MKYAIRIEREIQINRTTVLGPYKVPDCAKNYTARKWGHVSSLTIYPTLDHAEKAAKFERRVAEFENYSQDDLYKLIKSSIPEGFSARLLSKLMAVSYDSVKSYLCKRATISPRFAARFLMVADKIRDCLNECKQ